MCVACKIKMPDNISAFKHFANGGSLEHKAAIDSLKSKLTQSLQQAQEKLVSQQTPTVVVPAIAIDDDEDQVYQLIVEEELLEDDHLL